MKQLNLIKEYIQDIITNWEGRLCECEDHPNSQMGVITCDRCLIVDDLGATLKRLELFAVPIGFKIKGADNSEIMYKEHPDYHNILTHIKSMNDITYIFGDDSNGE